jgi:hypothetical protein
MLSIVVMFASRSIWRYRGVACQRRHQRTIGQAIAAAMARGQAERPRDGRKPS